MNEPIKPVPVFFMLGGYPIQITGTHPLLVDPDPAEVNQALEALERLGVEE